MPRCLPMFASSFLKFFHRFLLPTSTPGTSRIKPPLQREHDLSKSRFSYFALIFHRFWCQHASIFGPKIQQNRFKHRSGKASIFWSIFASMFINFWSILEANLEPCWPQFPPKWGGACGAPPSFLLGICCYSVLGLSWTPLGSVGLDFGRFGPRFGRFLGSILEVSWSRFGSHPLLAPYGFILRWFW